MKDKELIVILESTIHNLNEQLKVQSEMIVSLNDSIKELTSKVSKFENEAEKKKAKLNAVSKIAFNKKSEKQTLQHSCSSEAPEVKAEPVKRGNNGAKRKVYEVEEVL